MAEHVMPTYARLPVAFTRGEGVWLYDEKGDAYLDALSGIGVVNLGHACPAVTAAITQQVNALIHTSNLYRIPAQEALADKLAEVSGMDRIFFCNSGAEANEAAIKIARLYGHKKAITLPTIVVMEGAFHGRTMATLTATGNAKVQKGFEPLVEGFVRVPYGNIEALHALSENTSICAVLCEPVQGEGGVNPLPEGFLQELRTLCDENDWLLMLDEVQTGNGRTGTYFAFQQADILPDVVTTAKGLGNGVPIGACLAAGAARDVFSPGNHGSTYGGNHLACAAALAVVNSIDNDFLAGVRQKSALARNWLNETFGKEPWVKRITVKGLMLGIELDKPYPDLVRKALDNKLLINVTAEKVIRLLPPLIISESELQRLISSLHNLVSDAVRG